MKTKIFLGIIICFIAFHLYAEDIKIIKFDLFLKDTDNNNYTISHPWDMTFDREGSVYILDGEECNILKFSGSGEFINSIEIENKSRGKLCLGSIATKNEKLYYVSSWTFINTYDADGKLIESEGKKFTYSPQKACPEEFIIGDRYDGETNSKLLMRWDWSGRETDVIDKISWEKYLKFSKAKTNRAILAKNVDTHAYDFNSKGEIIFGKTSEYKVYKWIDGKKEQIIKEKYTVKLLPNEIREKGRLEKKNGRSDFYISNHYYPKIRNIMIDKEDNIWFFITSVERTGFIKYSGKGEFLAFYKIEPWYLFEYTKFYMSENYIYCDEKDSAGLKILRAVIPE